MAGEDDFSVEVAVMELRECVEAMQATLETVVGRLESIQASLDGLTDI